MYIYIWLHLESLSTPSFSSSPAGPGRPRWEWPAQKTHRSPAVNESKLSVLKVDFVNQIISFRQLSSMNWSSAN